MFGGVFNKMYYGDPRRPDLKKEDMKINRFKLFFTVLQIRIWQLIQLNLLYSVFWIPAFIVIQMQLVLSQETGEPITILFFLLLIPCLLLAGPATAGITYVMRNFARDDHAWVWTDFKDAWKQNWKESLLLMLINGIALMFFYINIVFYSGMVQQSLIYLVLQYLILMMGLIFAMMNMFIFPMLVTYKLSVKQILKNAFIFTMVKLPVTLGIFVLAAGIFILSALYLMSLPVFVVGFAIPGFIIVSYTNYMFDKYINIRTAAAEE